MRIIVTGRQGQVVRSLGERALRHTGLEVVAVGRPDFDLLDPGSIRAGLTSVRPDVVVSAAAYTAVDQAESEPEIAYRVNETGAAEVARAARSVGAPVIHLSTDYVFSGDQGEPYEEGDRTSPKSVYGASKLAGEVAVRAAHPEHLILRTAWVYSAFGRNFVKTVIGRARTSGRLRIVDDQRGNPTSATDIAEALLRVIHAWQAAHRTRPGLYHLAGTGDATWCSFARHVLDASRSRGGPDAEVEAVTTAEYRTAAERPRDSRLDCRRFAADYGYTAPCWRRSADMVVHRLLDGAVSPDSARRLSVRNQPGDQS